MQDKAQGRDSIVQDQCCGTKNVELTPFLECGIEEQISRLHAELKEAKRDLGYMYNTMSDLNRQMSFMKQHTHNENGDVVIRIDVIHNFAGIGAVQATRPGLL